MDFSLSDIAWVGGGLVALTIVSLCFTHRVEIAQAFRLEWLFAYPFEEDEEAAEPQPQRSAAPPHLNHAEPDEPPFANADALLLNADEVLAVARMIKHNATAAKPSKSSTIQAGFGVSRGGGATYMRASAIYDALFGQPNPAVLTPIAERPSKAPFAPRP